ncbi:MAG: TIR domain-containing protein [Acidimicrobiia bacterium]
MADVFISYAREDRARAKRLADALEARGLSVWWDREILAGQAFDEVIEAELHKAETVVVLWSMHSVASEWVKNEAAEAEERGTLVPARIDAVKPPLQFRRKQTVDLIDWEDEPDHPELDALCRGISAHLGRQSTPHPATPATLDPQRRPRRRARLFFWTGVASLILAGAALWYWDAFHRPHIEYYANVIKRWGLPEGIGPLTDEDVRHRNVSLAFHKRGRWGVVHEIRAVNSRGGYPPVFTYFPPVSFVFLNPFANELSEISGLCRVTFMRDADGRVVAQIGYNRSDRPLYTLHYAQPDFVEYKEGAFSKAVRESGITHIKFVRPETGPEAGLDKELLYFDRDGQPQPDRDGTYGYRSTFDALGLAADSTNLGADGQPAVRRAGTARQTFTYDDQGNVIREVNFGIDGQRVLSEISGSAERRYRYDQYGNLTEFASFGTEGQLVTSKNLGAAGMTRAYDNDGNVVEITFFGPDRQLVIGNLGVAKVTMVWDEKGRSFESYFGPDGKPVPIAGRVIKT